MERLQKTVNSAKERVRKTSVTILGGGVVAGSADRRESRKEVAAATNLAFDGASAISIEEGEENNNDFKASRMHKRDPYPRWISPFSSSGVFSSSQGLCLPSPCPCPAPCPAPSISSSLFQTFLST